MERQILFVCGKNSNNSSSRLGEVTYHHMSIVVPMASNLMNLIKSSHGRNDKAQFAILASVKDLDW